MDNLQNYIGIVKTTPTSDESPLRWTKDIWEDRLKPITNDFRQDFIGCIA